MAYTGNTNWQRNDVVEPGDMNRIERGITDLDTGKLNVNGTAVSANKLATPRTIGLTGVIVGTPTAFDGTASISIPVTKIDYSKTTDVTPLINGGTGATTAAQARTNLGTAPISHATSATTYGVGNGTNYGHVKLSDTFNETDDNSKGIAVTPKALNSVKALVQVNNYLHNWDFSNPYIATSNQLVGSGTFLSRWYSASSGNSLTINPNSGLSYYCTAAGGYFSQLITKDLLNLFSRTITFGIWIAELPASQSIQVGLYTHNSDGTASTIATKSLSGNTASRGLLFCTGEVPATYDRIECRIQLGVANQTVIIQKAKLEIGSESTLKNTDAADKAAHALLCRSTDVNGAYIGGNSVIASATIA